MCGMRSSVPSHPPAARRTLTGALLTLLAVLALAGCVKANAAMNLNPDDTVSGTMVFAVEDDAAEQFGISPQDLWSQARDQITGELPQGTTEKPYAKDGWTGVEVTLPDTPIDQLTSIGGETVSVTRDGDEYVVAGTVDLTDMVKGQENLPLEVLGEFDISLAVTFPGPVTSSNGTVSGSTVTWKPPAGERTAISARGSAVGPTPSASPTTSSPAPVAESSPATAAAAGQGGGPQPWVWGVGAGVLLALVGLGAWLWARRGPAPAGSDAVGPGGAA
jgi:hypothetical protein